MKISSCAGKKNKIPSHVFLIELFQDSNYLLNAIQLFIQGKFVAILPCCFFLRMIHARGIFLVGVLPDLMARLLHFQHPYTNKTILWAFCKRNPTLCGRESGSYGVPQNIKPASAFSSATHSSNKSFISNRYGPPLVGCTRARLQICTDAEGTSRIFLT